MKEEAYALFLSINLLQSDRYILRKQNGT